MNEAERQREYVKGLRLVEEAFTVLRGPLDIDEQPSETRVEVYIARQLMKARDELYTLICERQAQGITAAPKEDT